MKLLSILVAVLLVFSLFRVSMGVEPLQGSTLINELSQLDIRNSLIDNENIASVINELERLSGTLINSFQNIVSIFKGEGTLGDFLRELLNIADSAVGGIIIFNLGLCFVFWTFCFDIILNAYRITRFILRLAGVYGFQILATG